MSTEVHALKRYTVVPLFNKDGSKVLLLKKDRTTFAGKWNGVGGKIEDKETPMDGAYREIFEETSLTKDDIENLTWLGTLTLPEQCDERNPDAYPELYFFSGIVKDESKATKPDDSTEVIEWFRIVDGRPVGYIPGGNMYPFKPQLAGDGDLQYFIERGLRILFGWE